MSVIVTDIGFTADIFDGVTIDLTSDFDPLEIDRDHLNAGMIRVDFPSSQDGRGFTIAAQLRRRGFQGHLRAKGPILADQYAMARRSGFDDVEIPDDLATRQPEPQWRARADWRAHDYQNRLRA